MKRTPDPVSKERQKINRELCAWMAGIRDARCALDLGEASKEETEKKILYAQEKIDDCNKRMHTLNYSGKCKKPIPLQLRKPWTPQI